MTCTELETVYAKNLDETRTEAIEVRHCCVVNLPFRLRIGNSYTFPKSDEGDFKLYFRNLYEIPPTGIKIEDLKEQASKRGRDNFFYTKVLIILKKSRYNHSALKVLNDFIVAYGTVTTSPISLFGENVRTLTEMEFSKACEWEIKYHCPKGYILTDSDVDKLINKKHSLTFNLSIIPDLKIKDLSLETLKKIPSAFELHKKFIFYEFAYEAKVRMLSEDYITAVFMACIALEGVHGAFLNYVRISKNEKKCERNLNNKSKRERSVPGFYRRLKNTISKYLDSQEKPSEDLMTKCETAIKIRDSVMHAISTKGVYEFRKYQRSDFVEAYQTILQIYEYFRKALENRVG
jgi:hypothetical protein